MKAWFKNTTRAEESGTQKQSSNLTFDYVSNDMISLITLRQVSFSTQTVPYSVLSPLSAQWVIENSCC